MKYTIGAYATAPSTITWNEGLESQYYQQLKSIDNIDTIEHPFTGKLHPIDDDWFLTNIDKDWQFIFTSIPGVMANLAQNPFFGIASTNEDGREAALAFYKQAKQAITKLNQYLGRQAVSYIKIHTAPKISITAGSSTEALEQSLKTMQSWNWDGAKLIIEHCDAYIPGQAAEKGFLKISDEIAVVTAVNKALNCDIGISINWGRSAIEARSENGPIEHIKMAYKSKLLKGIIFSGVSKQNDCYGKWKDSHVPPAPAFNISHAEKNSLMTIEQIEKSLQQCNPQQLNFIGTKISLRSNDVSIAERVAYIQSALTLIVKAIE